MKIIPVNGYKQQLDDHLNRLQYLCNHLLSNAENLEPKETADPSDNTVRMMSIDSHVNNVRNTLNVIAKVVDQIEADCNEFTGRIVPEKK